jgi:4-amino-4-deoxy-L-arabinose transferase-like glycosyltransferase
MGQPRIAVRGSGECTRIAPRELALVSAVALGWTLLVRAGPLSLPYFWDEADVYVAGARWLADHDMDPTPGHFPDDWSRGHPPLLYVVAAIAFRLAGPAPVVGHLVALPFGVLSLVATYALALERHGRAVAIAAAGALAATPLHLTMGAFLLPEMPLTALTAAALWALHRERMDVVAALGVAMVWLKETGIFTAGAIGVAVLLAHARAGTLRSRRAAVELALLVVPLVALVAFFVWQRVNAGYFVFPHHQGLLAERHFEPASLFTAVPSIFVWHGRWLLGLAAVVAAVVLVRRGMRPLPGTVEHASLLLALFNVAFFAQMFWLERYALPAHPGLIVLALGLAWRAARETPALRARATVVPMALGAFALVAGLRGALPTLRPPPEGEAPELSFAYADVMRSHREVARLLEARAGALPPDPLVVGVWPLTVELRDPVLGFAARPFRTLHVDHLDDHPTSRVDVVVIDPSSRNRDRLRALADEAGLAPLGTVTVGVAPPLEVRARTRTAEDTR